MIAELGHFCLIIAFASALVLTFKPRVSAVYTQFLFILVSFLTLTYCFVINDFSVAYVARNAYSKLPLIYKICAVWGAHEGSLLLWAFILSCWTLAVACRTPQPRVLSILGAINAGFMFLLLHTSNPFERLLPHVPQEGLDLNPLLQDPGFVLHPPFLYLGYVGMTVPFAFCLAALIDKTKTKINHWERDARPWTLLAWGFLTIGIVLGSWWAYYELGWGGWWFWDPVENASFMPWLVGGALCHALMIKNKENFVYWRMLLAMSAFILSLIGTFLVRSGVVSSVHAFASDPKRGLFILLFLVIVIGAGFGLLLYRFYQAPRAKAAVAGFSKESFIFLGNILCLVSALIILLGTLYPLFIDVLLHEKLSVGPPYFNQVFIPMMIGIMLLMIVTPHLSLKFIKKTAILLPSFFLLYFFFPFYCGIALGICLAISTLFTFKIKKIKTFGMTFAHLGLALAVLGATLVTKLEIEAEKKMVPGEEITVGGFQFKFAEIGDTAGPNYVGKKAHFTIKKENNLIAEGFPEKRYFIPRNLPMTETAICVKWTRDFYIALGEGLEDGSWIVRLYIKPFIRWIWLGGLLIAMGAMFSSFSAFRVKDD